LHDSKFYKKRFYNFIININQFIKNKQGGSENCRRRLTFIPFYLKINKTEQINEYCVNIKNAKMYDSMFYKRTMLRVIFTKAFPIVCSADHLFDYTVASWIASIHFASKRIKITATKVIPPQATTVSTPFKT